PSLTTSTRPHHDPHLLHPLPDRPLQARALRALRRNLGPRDPAQRRPPAGLLHASRRHERRGLGPDRLRQPCRLRGLPRAPARRPGRPCQLRIRRNRALHPARAAQLCTRGAFELPAIARRARSPSMITVLFEVTPLPGRAERYFEIAAALAAELQRIDGFVSVERFESLTRP